MKNNTIKQYSKWFRFLNFLIIPFALLSIGSLFIKSDRYDFFITVGDFFWATLYVLTFITETVKINRKKKK